MSTTVYPYLSKEKLKEAEDEATIKELCWLIESLEEETFQALKNGIEECLALLAPVHPGSTLVLSSHRSENIKGHVTRIGSQIVKGTINLRLRTHTPLNLSIVPVSSTTSSNHELFLPNLKTLSTLLEQALSSLCSVHFSSSSPRVGHTSSITSTSTTIFSQLKLLYTLFHESLSILKGFNLHPSQSSSFTPSPYEAKAWNKEPLKSVIFTPELPPTLALDIDISDCSLLLTIRVLELCSQTPTISSLFLTGIGVQRRLEHDEMDQEFLFRGKTVRVKEKCQVESSADPCLLSCAAKLQALERSTLCAMDAIRALTGRDEELD